MPNLNVGKKRQKSMVFNIHRQQEAPKLWQIATIFFINTAIPHSIIVVIICTRYYLEY